MVRRGYLTGELAYDAITEVLKQLQLRYDEAVNKAKEEFMAAATLMGELLNSAFSLHDPVYGPGFREGHYGGNDYLKFMRYKGWWQTGRRDSARGYARQLRWTYTPLRYRE
jgi:hypothetical protein